MAEDGPSAYFVSAHSTSRAVINLLSLSITLSLYLTYRVEYRVDV
jgi:hypothetical protein